MKRRGAKTSVSIEVLDAEGESKGQVKAGYGTHLSLNGLSTGGKQSNTTDYPVSLGQDYIGRSSDLAAHYLVLNDEGALPVKHPISADSFFKTDNQTVAQTNTAVHLPDGAVIALGKHPFCIISGDTCFRTDSLAQAYQKISDSECQDIAQKSYHYNCGKNRTITSCDYATGYDVSGFYFRLGGTCINSKSGEKCTFDSLYSGDDQWNLGIEDNIDCSKCSAQYLNTTIFNNPQYENKCSPSKCIGGCPGSNKNSGTGHVLVAPIVGSVVGGIALIGTISLVATVAGCLIYKHKHRSSYQEL